MFQVLDMANWQHGIYMKYAIVDAFSSKQSPKYPKEPFSTKKHTTLRRVYSKEETEAFIRESEKDG